MTEPIVVERRVSAAPAAVFTYLVDSERWVLWQGTDAEIDARPGGVFAVTMPNGARVGGEFVEVIQDRRVTFSWGWVGHEALPPGSSTVEIELLPEDGGTLVRLTHRGVPPEEMELHRMGWDRYVSRLTLAAEGGTLEPDSPPDVTE